MHVITELDPNSGALFARNSYNTEFVDRVAFFDVDDVSRTLTGDRTEFLGRNGTLRNPAAMTRLRLSGKVGTALDPCAAIQVPFELAAGQEREIIFRLGAGRDVDDACKLVRRFQGAAAARGALEEVWQYWNNTLGAVQVETPDQSVNVLTNGWLLYQTLRVPSLGPERILPVGRRLRFPRPVAGRNGAHPRRTGPRARASPVCAGHQFKEGDVQHWWHPSLGRGVRTHCSDDFLWLPLAVSRYVLTTGRHRGIG